VIAIGSALLPFIRELANHAASDDLRASRARSVAGFKLVDFRAFIAANTLRLPRAGPRTCRPRRGLGLAWVKPYPQESAALGLGKRSETGDASRRHRDNTAREYEHGAGKLWSSPCFRNLSKEETTDPTIEAREVAPCCRLNGCEHD
jgi:hypothetical protein